MRYHPFAHVGLKVVSVAFAVMLWFMVSSQRAAVERGLRIPLELQNLPVNLEMMEPPQANNKLAHPRSRPCKSENSNPMLPRTPRSSSCPIQPMQVYLWWNK